ncbi:MAG: hypothetical protein PF961_21170 [Planctomycetota bacterium]|jgi:DNA polymerase III delta subunit|nr:hypothetical protein [Planctomycetota bacterium]
MGLMDARLHAVVGASWRLRDDVLAQLLADWSGPVKRLVEPKDLHAIVLGLDTPSLFEAAACYVLSAEDKYLSRNREVLLPLCEGPATAGVLIVVTGRLPKNEALGKRLAAAGSYHDVSVPSGRELEGWLIGRLMELEDGVDQPRSVAEALIDHRGSDIDGLLAAVQQAVDYAGDGPLTAAAVNAVVGGDADQPVWAFTDAVLQGQAARAIKQLHAGSGLEAHQALGVLVGELRKALCCLATEDDAEAGRFAGLRGRPRLYHARRRARELGRRCLLRLLNGALQGQRELRRGGVDADQIIETLCLNVQRVIRMGDGFGKPPARTRRRA